jgi:hypothetical protein
MRTFIYFAILSFTQAVYGDPPKNPRDEIKNRIDQLQSQAISKDRVAALQRVLLIDRVAFMIYDIENHQELIDNFKNSTDPVVQRQVGKWKAKLDGLRADFAQFEQENKADATLFKQAKLVRAEEKRLHELAKAKGVEHYKSEKCQQALAFQLVEFMLDLQK